MGVLVILAIDFFVALISQQKSPTESSKRLGATLVILSLTFNGAMTLVDLYRGYEVGSSFSQHSDYVLPMILNGVPSPSGLAIRN